MHGRYDLYVHHRQGSSFKEMWLLKLWPIALNLQYMQMRLIRILIMICSLDLLCQRAIIKESLP